MKLKVYNTAGEVTGEVEVSDKVFGAEVKPHLCWEVVRWQQAKRRAGTHKSQTRSEVSATTKKPFRQKGTGRARHGSYRAPIFVGGGSAHGPKPRDYGYRLNKKIRAGALRSALSDKVVQERLMIVDEFALPEIKTRRAVEVLGNLQVKKALVVDSANNVLDRSMRNLEHHKYLPVAGLNVYDLLRYETVIMTRSALEAVEGRLSV